MKLEKDTMITLDNTSRYLVVETSNFKGKDYAYIINEDDTKDVKFCVEEHEGEKIKLTVVTDQTELADVSLHFFALLKDEIEDILNEDNEGTEE